MIEEEIKKRVAQAIVEKTFPGCAVGIVKRSGERSIFTHGNFTYEGSSPRVREDTLYDLASITKSIPTGSLALRLIDEGKLKLSDKLIDYIPEFRNSDREKVLIKHLLTYTLDGYGMASLKKKTAKEMLDTLLTHDFEKPPGSIFKYSNIPATLLGLVLEKIHNKPLDEQAQEYFFEPLNMNRTTFFPERYSKTEIPPTEIDGWRGLVQGMVHDESAYICKQDGKITGHAGLFSTAPDLLNFMEMLLQNGNSGGRQYFSPTMMSAMSSNQIAELGDSTGLGWELYQPRYMGKFCTPQTFGKTGFTGTLCVADVGLGVAYVILSNRTYPRRPADSSAMNKFRADMGNIILKS